MRFYFLLCKLLQAPNSSIIETSYRKFYRKSVPPKELKFSFACPLPFASEFVFPPQPIVLL